MSPALVEQLMKMERDSRCGQIIVTALVNGQPLRMMLDTGATHTVLHADSVAKLGKVQWLDTAGVAFEGNSEQRPRLMLGSLLVGPGHSPVHPLVVMNLDAVRSMMAEKIDGIVGMDFLASLPFTFDFRTNSFFWGIPEGDLNAVPVECESEPSGRVRWKVTCGGRSLKLLLDTGSSITRVCSADWAPGPAGQITAEMGDIDTAVQQQFTEGKPGDLQIAPGLVLKGVTPLLSDSGESAVLGLDALKNATLIHLPSEQSPAGQFLLSTSQKED